MAGSSFMRVDDVAKELGVSKSYAYKLIRKLNGELKSVREVGGEQYILSSVMHADERNKSLSEELNRDVYHYHLHVVYIPVVEKEIQKAR